jgi:diguanylate cyclase (GGDEF)-like protein/PAS domain S-box-containing protein
MVYEQSPCLIAMQGRYITGYVLVSVFSIILIILHSQYTTSLLQRLQLQQKLQDELHESHGELDQIFNTAADGMWLVDFNKEIIRANTTMALLLNLPVTQIIGKKCHEIFSGDLCHTEECPLHLISQGNQHIVFEADKSRTDGTTLTCLVNAKPFYNGNGDLIGMIEDFCDITARKKMEQQLQSLSVTDELTGLCNRRGFMALARQQLSYVKRAGGTAFLVFADLDNMKWINDTLGHEIGDKALILTARLLQTTVRGTDIIGRMGGDEFAVLFTSASKQDSEAILLARLEQELAEINKELPGQLQIAISFGVAHNAGDYSLEELLITADARMYTEKKRRKTEAAYKTQEIFV